MITVNTRNLVEAILEADAFTLPDMNEGTRYLFDSLYKELSRGEDVRLSHLDFDAFEEEDLNSLNDLYSGVFERNFYAANDIVSTLLKSSPVCKAAAYV